MASLQPQNNDDDDDDNHGEDHTQANSFTKVRPNSAVAPSVVVSTASAKENCSERSTAVLLTLNNCYDLNEWIGAQRNS